MASTTIADVRAVPKDEVVWAYQLPIQSQSRLYYEEWEEAAGPAELATIAKAADDAGCFAIAVCDHTAIPTRLAERMSTVWWDTVATLGFLAAHTSRVRLLSHVLILAQRHPLRAAKEFATLDLLSNGRIIIGVGAGHVEEEYELYSKPFAARGRATDEAITSLALALSEEFPTLPGPIWPAAGLGAKPRPVQSPRPPIWVGGSSAPALRRAGMLGDGWLPQGTPRAQMPEQIATIKTIRETHRAGAPIDIGTVVETIHLTGVGEKTPPATAQLIGPPEQIAESLAEFVAMGVNFLLVRFPANSMSGLIDQMAAFGESVAPLLNA